MKTTHLLALTAALCLALTSCVPTSDNPLSSANVTQADPFLIGTWLERTDQETYHITKKNKNWLHVDVTKQSGEKSDSYDFFTTTIGVDTYANVVLVGKDSQGRPTKTFTFIRYSVSEDRDQFKMWSMSSELTAAAVHAGKLKGTLSGDKKEDVNLTDTSANLVKFISGSDPEKLFTNEAVLVRIDLATK